MSVRVADTNVSRILADLYELRGRLRESPSDEMRDRLVRGGAGYLVMNEALIRQALDAWSATPEDDLKALAREYRELDISASTPKFRAIADSSLRFARDSLMHPETVEMTDDEVHMLARALEYGKYLTDTSGQEVRWSPITLVLEGNLSAVDELAAEVREQGN
jgi:hypothetical protein